MSSPAQLALFGHAVARGAGHADRDHAAAALVSVPTRNISYWSRTVIVPLLVLMALKPQRAISGVHIYELFLARRGRIGRR